MNELSSAIGRIRGQLANMRLSQDDRQALKTRLSELIKRRWAVRRQWEEYRGEMSDDEWRKTP